MKKPNFFTNEEDAILKKFYPNTSLTDLSRMLSNRHTSVIYKRAKRFKLRQTKTYLKKVRLRQLDQLKLLKERNTKKLKSYKLDTNSAYILGTILGDGHIYNSHVYVCSKDLDFLEGIKETYQSWSGLRATIKKYKTGRGNDLYYVFFNSKEASKFFKSIKLNQIKLENLKTSFLRGFFDAEGSAYIYNRYRKDRNKFYLEYGVQVCNTNLKLIRTIKRFLKDLNIYYGYRSYIHKNSYGKLPKHVIKIKISSIPLFYEKIGFGMARKNNNLEKIVSIIKQRGLRR